MPNISARTFVTLYWGGQVLAFLLGVWLTPQDPSLLTRVYGGLVTLMMFGVFALQILWIWRQLKVAVAPVAASNSRISRLLAQTQALGRASLVGLLILAAINVTLGRPVADSMGWLQGVSAIVVICLLTSGGLAALCLCKAEVEINSQAKPSAFWTFWQFFYAGLSAGAIARRTARVASDAAHADVGRPAATARA